MTDCRELTRLVASGELAGVSLWRRAGLRLHLWMCRHCRQYTRQIETIDAEAGRATLMTDADEAAMRRLESDLEP